jgi:tripartite-type tricarboxylate transporter receptor subunit TctC
MAGVNMVHVLYRNAASVFTDLISGQMQVMFVTTAASIGYIRSGELRALAVTTATRTDMLPDLPALTEFVSGYEDEASTWLGIGAPKNTPTNVISKLNNEINAALVSRALTAALAEQGGRAIGGSPAEFGNLIADETEKWGKVIRTAGIKAE